MSEDKGRQEIAKAAASGDHLEEKGIVADVVVPLAAGGAGGAAAGAAEAYVSNLLQSEPSDPPPPPSVELPPGVDRD